MKAVSFASALIIAALTGRGWAQNTPAARHPTAISEIGRSSVWPHIGAPPAADAPSSREEQWRREKASFAEARDLIKLSWSGEPAANSEELGRRVGEYEGLILTLTESGGYGNLLLADCLRRFSNFLIMQFIVAHPAEYAAVKGILAKETVKQLESPAVRDMLSEELKLPPPPGGWHLSESRAQMDLVLKAGAAGSEDPMTDVMFHPPTVSRLLANRDVSGLLMRMMMNETLERISIPGALEFLERGGRLGDLNAGDVTPFEKVMGDRIWAYKFPPLGVTSLGMGRVGSVLELARRWGGKRFPFEEVVEE